MFDHRGLAPRTQYIAYVRPHLGRESALILGRSWGSVIGIEEHFVAKQGLDSPQNFIATTLGYRSSVPGIASFPRELVGYLLDAHKQHG